MKKFLSAALFLSVLAVSFVAAETYINRPGITIQEVDGNPSLRVQKLVVPNGSLTAGTGFATLTFAAGGGGSGGGAGYTSYIDNQNPVSISSRNLNSAQFLRLTAGTSEDLSLNPSSVTMMGPLEPRFAGIAASTGNIISRLNQVGLDTGTIRAATGTLVVRLDQVGIDTGTIRQATGTLSVRADNLDQATAAATSAINSTGTALTRLGLAVAQATASLTNSTGTAWQDEGVPIFALPIGTANCVGAGITCTQSGGVVTLNVPGGGVSGGGATVLPLPQDATNYLQNVATGSNISIPLSTITPSGIAFPNYGKTKIQQQAGFEWLCSSVADANISSLTCVMGSTRTQLMIYVNIAGASTIADVRLTFNGDAAGNYGAQRTVANTTTSSSSAAGLEPFASADFSANPRSVFFDAYDNDTGHVKHGGMRATTGPSNATAPRDQYGNWIWNNSSVVITTAAIDLLPLGNGVTMNAGSEITIYGAQGHN